MKLRYKNARKATLPTEKGSDIISTALSWWQVFCCCLDLDCPAQYSQAVQLKKASKIYKRMLQQFWNLTLNLFNRYLQFKKLPRKERTACTTCGIVLLPGELNEHEKKGHVLRHKVKLHDLQHPTSFFAPYEDNKTYAVSIDLSVNRVKHVKLC